MSSAPRRGCSAGHHRCPRTTASSTQTRCQGRRPPAGAALDHCNGQVSAALRDVTEEQIARVAIAYEPVWAIGTGGVAAPQDAQEVCGEVRLTLRQLYSAHVSDQARVLYGGSVKASNAPELMTEPDVDGALVGGASLSPDEFLGIVRAAASTAGRMASPEAPAAAACPRDRSVPVAATAGVLDEARERSVDQEDMQGTRRPSR